MAANACAACAVVGEGDRAPGVATGGHGARPAEEVPSEGNCR